VDEGADRRVGPAAIETHTEPLQAGEVAVVEQARGAAKSILIGISRRHAEIAGMVPGEGPMRISVFALGFAGGPAA